MADRTPRMILAEIDKLVADARDMKVTLEDAADTALQARKVNGRLWAFLNTVEAGMTEELYDCLGALNTAYVQSGEQSAHFITQLIMAGALVIRPKPLLDELRRYGIDPADFTFGEEEDADTHEAG